jgi:hypothetical protein
MIATNEILGSFLLVSGIDMGINSMVNECTNFSRDIFEFYGNFENLQKNI